jgi:hypothetical protein
MAVLATQRILTLDYWKTAHNLKVGDIVFDKNGVPCKVTLIQEYRANDCYRVQFNDFLEVCGDQHLGFLAETPKYREQIHRYKGVRKWMRPLNFTQIKDLLESDVRYSVPTTDPIQLPHQTLPVPPFVFGFWYFNTRHNKRLAAPKGLVKVVYEELQNAGYQVFEHRKVSTGEKEFSIYPTVESHLVGNMPTRIPNNYLLASVEQRIELLRGILHAKSRQYSKPKDTFRFTSKHYPTVLQIQGLLESLGHKIKIYYDEYRNNYKITFRSKLKLMEDQILSKPLIHNGRRYINNITKLPSQLCVHIETDGPDNSFLVGEGFISCL